MDHKRIERERLGQAAFPFHDPQPRRPRPRQGHPVQMDAQRGRELKAAGQDRAEQGADWSHDVLGELALWLRRAKAAGLTEFVFEKFRSESRCKPASHKAWGSLPRRAVKLGLIRPSLHADGTPKMAAAASVKTHAHLVRLWEIV